MIRQLLEGAILSLSILTILYAASTLIGSALDREQQFEAQRLEPYLEAEKQFQHEQARKREMEIEEQLTGHCY